MLLDGGLGIDPLPLPDRGGLLLPVAPLPGARTTGAS
jgi:hypothetical protein